MKFGRAPTTKRMRGRGVRARGGPAPSALSGLFFEGWGELGTAANHRCDVDKEQPSFRSFLNRNEIGAGGIATTDFQQFAQ
jgi:hypothetical protein